MFFYLFVEPRLTTSSLNAEFKNLLPCESYLFAVGVVGPIGPGPLTRNPTTMTTQFNPIKPPKNLKVDVNEKTEEMIIKWEHNCPLTADVTSYLVTVTELTFNKTVRVQLQPSRNTSMSHVFKGIPLGARYNISISNDHPNAETVSLLSKSADIPTPTNLIVFPEKNGSYVVFWKPVFELKNSVK